MIEINENAKIVMNILNENGFQSFVCGGAIRDSIIGIEPKDWDVTTDATPDDVMNVFHNFNVIPTGIEHGTITVMVNGEGIEVTTFRQDVNFSGGHSCGIEFVTSIEDDLARRDFTINAIAIGIDGNVVDPFGGMEDIRNGIVRFVGNAVQRIVEDPLRMMRGIRFEAQKGFCVDPEGILAIANNAGLIEKISSERIMDEIRKIIVSNPAKLSRLWEVGILEVIMPEVNVLFDTIQNNPHHIWSMVANHTIVAMQNIENRFDLRLAMMFHDTGKAVTKTTGEDGIDHFINHEIKSADIAERVMRRMKMDNDTIEKVVCLVANHGRDIANTNKAVKRVVRSVGVENFVDLIAVKVADDMAKDTNREDVRGRIENASALIETFNNIMEQNEVFDRSGLVVNGHDMMKIGFVGREIKIVLEHLVEVVIDDPEMNDRETLMGIAQNMFD